MLATLPGNGRADGDDLLGRQDVLRDGLEDRLGVRAARELVRRGRRRPSSSSPSSAARRSSTRSPTRSRCPTPTSRASPPACGPSATGCAPGWRRPGLEVHRPAGTYFVNADIRAAGGGRTGSPSAGRCPSARASSRCPTVVFYDDQAVGRPLVRFAFCKRDEVIDEAAARLARRPATRSPTLPGRVRHRGDEVRRDLRRRRRAHQARRAPHRARARSRASTSSPCCRRAARRRTS